MSIKGSMCLYRLTNTSAAFSMLLGMCHSFMTRLAQVQVVLSKPGEKNAHLRTACTMRKNVSLIMICSQSHDAVIDYKWTWTCFTISSWPYIHID